ncbi:S4 domain-containing protein YaaA [Bacillus altitudinis]|uniref:S4 domain-containing protein YaaA n=1 Tax=Bacillus altitudinis TaxID=293387 RepID=UPI00174B40B0|nr:S4 domain-containing protein YaaA [Bacillus altitudinis]NQW97562.1 S4 domain-containing protein YaaA [Bacillus stratosphericus]UTV32919.1 S4 domain-containing protein YaaA [Bacillus altitudinis]
MPNLITIETEMITLGQFLKLAEVIQSGGMAKWFLNEHEVFINQEPDNRRGRKLYPGDVVEIEGHGTFQVVN